MPVPQVPSGQFTSPQANGLVNAMNNITNDMISPAAAIETSKTADATTQGKHAMYVQSITTDALTSNQVIYRGWGHTGNLAAGSGTITITLPNSGFDSTDYDVAVMYLGEKTTGAPTSRADVNQFNSGAIVHEDATLPRSATQFRISFLRSAGLFPWVIFSWIAIGTKA